jgi:DNA-binding NarL/FixJ family response regulator
VVIADDQTLVRSGFRMILGAAGIPVVAEAADGQEAVAAVLKHRPDVVLMDIRMPEMDGLEATRQILAARPGPGQPDHHPHHVRLRPVRLRRAQRRCQRLPAQGRHP